MARFAGVALAIKIDRTVLCRGCGELLRESYKRPGRRPLFCTRKCRGRWERALAKAEALR